MTQIVFSPEAISDLEQTKKYITEDLQNEQAATNTLQKIIKNIRVLEKFPQSGPSLTAIVDFDTDYRYLVCGNYTSFYRYENNTVYIVRVLYGRRDFMRILFGEPKEK